MRQNHIQLAFLLGLFAVVAVLAAALFFPFLKVIVLAGVTAIILQPAYGPILRFVRGRAWAASLLSILLLFLVVGGPLAFIVERVFEESRDVYSHLQDNGNGYVHRLTSAIEEPIRRYSPYFTLDLRSYGQSVFGWITSNIGGVVTGTLQVFLGLFLFIITLFFFLRDGKTVVATIIAFSPLDDEHDKKITGTVVSTINSVIRGMVFVGIIQGLLVGFGLWVFGVPNATLWGTFAALAAMIPGLGTALVTLPAVAYLLIIDRTGAAIGLAVWAFAIVGLVDNILAPYFYSKGIHIHQLLILFAVLGGIAMFGVFGFLYGPIILSVFVALLHVYRSQSAQSAK